MEQVSLKLPDILSDLIMVAVEDVKKLPDNIHMDMKRWVGTDSRGVICSVCLAGAVMLNNSPSEHEIDAWDRDTSNKLAALDDIRQMHLLAALRRLDSSLTYEVGEFYKFTKHIKPLEGIEGKHTVIDTMTKVANWLKEKGL